MMVEYQASKDLYSNEQDKFPAPQQLIQICKSIPSLAVTWTDKHERCAMEQSPSQKWNKWYIIYRSCTCGSLYF